MALPRKTTSQIFSVDQRVAFKAHYWDTTATAVRLGEGVPVNDRMEAFGTGLEFALFDIEDASFTLNTANPEGDFILGGSLTSVLGYDGSNDYRTGVVPNIYAYWGAGAPPGGRKAKRVLMKFSGYVQESTGPVTLVFAGQGQVYVRTTLPNLSVVPLLEGSIAEPSPTADTVTVSPTVIRNEWGYQYTAARTFTAGEYVEIYYWHNGEPWGGIAAKVVPGTIPTTSEAFLTAVREAPVLGVSFMAKEQNPLAATVLPYLVSASVKQGVGEITTMTLSVALARAEEPDGYRWDPTERRLVDNANAALSLRLGRLVHLEGGYVRPDASEELYPRFTGYIDEIFPSSDGDTAEVVCRALDGRLAETFDENTPERLDYHAAGFILREPSSEPVFGIPAADNWPVETLLLAFAARAGIDHWNLGLKPGAADSDHGRRVFADATTGDLYFGQRLIAARGIAEGTLLQLDRNTNYGNVPPLKKDFIPDDDQYLFPPELTKRLYDHVRNIAELFGYDFGFNTEGQCVFEARNNPVYFQYATRTGTYSASAPATNQLVAVGAVGGIYHGVRHSVDNAWTRIVQGHFSRLDMYVGIGENVDGFNGGLIQVVVERTDGVGGWVQVSDTTYSTYAATDEAFYYNGVLTSSSANAAVIPVAALPFDLYRVTISAAGPDTTSQPGATDCWYRLNGVAVYERDREQAAFAEEFSTLGNALQLQAESNAKEHRNHVIVVGGRRATVTDSDKFSDSESRNPNNPEQEFHVSVAVDAFSIYDPASNNFAGSKRMTVVFDDKITDSAHAQWLARTILLRYQNPPTSANLTHTGVPILELRDALLAVEERHLTVQHLLWVQGFTERWAMDEATVSIDTSAYPEIPSYQPREDIDIDTLFVDPADGKGEPIINFGISYRNIYGRAVDNTTLSRADEIKAFRTRAPGEGRFVPMASETITDAFTHTTAYPPIPETMYLGWGGKLDDETSFSTGGKGLVRYNRRALVNGPYRRFYDLSFNTSTHVGTLAFDFQEGDGTANVYSKTYYGFPIANTWKVHYDYLTQRTVDATPAENPWYEPYTSELGNLVDISFDLLVSGRVRASVWAYSDSLGLEVPVAWLTSPSADPEEPEAHWTFLDAGRVSFSFDGVDNIGFWNTLQSFEYAEALKGAFGDKPMAVGRGFYAWNDKATNLHTCIGDDNTWDNNDGRGARKINYDADGAPYYTIGQFSQFYIKVEVANDTLLRRDYVNGTTQPRAVESRELPTANGMNDVAETYIWQHLGEPSQAAMRIQDWTHVDGGGVLTQTWTQGTSTDDNDWNNYSTPDADATLRVGKPVRITFVPRPHRGPMWELANGTLSADRTSVKLTRQVHHKGTVFDQFWHLSGKVWDGFHKDWVASASGIEQKRLQNRMYHNEDHTLEFEDSNWRTGLALSAYEWIFDPTLFEKDFGFGLREALRYADYEQLEQLPGFDARQLGGTSATERAYMMLAYMAHLFYFSAFTIDRSGRRQHCLNSWTDGNGDKRGKIDKTKIVSSSWLASVDDPTDVTNYKPTRIVDYETRGADRYLVRSMFVRQWVEPGWLSGTYPQNPVSKYSIVNAHELAYVQPYATDFELQQNPHPLVDVSGVEDSWLQVYQTDNSKAARNVRYRGGGTDKVLDLLIGGLDFIPASKALGTWNFNRPGLSNAFIPSPARDFHPYIRYPLTPDVVYGPNAYLSSESGGASGVNVLEVPTSTIIFEHRDFSAQEQWYGYAFMQGFAEDYFDANPGESAEIRHRYFGARLEMTVEELGALGRTSRTDTASMNRTKIEALFDYARLDQLDRWEQFRGLRARAPYAERNDWGAGDRRRRAPVQPVKPSGTYLFSVGKLPDYVYAPVAPEAPEYVHWTSDVTDFYALRFWHEYVWYNDRYFPVSRNGGPTYMFLRDEFTGVSGWIGYPWMGGPADEAVNPTEGLYYDAGAWVGWRPDLTSFTNLKWKDTTSDTQESINFAVIDAIQGDPDSLTWVNVPFESPPGPGMFTAFRQANILDEYFSKANGPRLAVGPTLAEEQILVMNLTLPERLRG